LTVMEENSYAADAIKHCIRPNDMTGKSGVLLLRQIHVQHMREARKMQRRVVIRNWLHEIKGLEDPDNYIEPFVQEEINMVSLKLLTECDLKAMAINKMGPRKIILAAIVNMRGVNMNSLMSLQIPSQLQHYHRCAYSCGREEEHNYLHQPFLSSAMELSSSLNEAVTLNENGDAVHIYNLPEINSNNNNNNNSGNFSSTPPGHKRDREKGRDREQEKENEITTNGITTRTPPTKKRKGKKRLPLSFKRRLNSHPPTTILTTNPLASSLPTLPPLQLSLSYSSLSNVIHQRPAQTSEN